MVDESNSTLSIMTTTMTGIGSSSRSLEAPSPSPLPTWKLYDNPHYSLRPQIPAAATSSSSKRSLLSARSRPSYHTRDLSSFSRTPAMDGGGGGARNRHVSLSDLDRALGEIRELRSELEQERRMRRKAEAASRALAREKEAAEERCRRLEEERRMMQAAETVREERVQMKLAEARVVMMMMDGQVKEASTNEGEGEGEGEGCGEAAVATKGRSDEGGRSGSNGSSTSSSSSALAKKEVENPHIKRGIKGMEFPRVKKGGSGLSPRSREGRGGGGGGGQLGSISNLECQRAQLRVLMRNKSSISSGAAHNLVM